jgi:uncharacterized membrane protein
MPLARLIVVLGGILVLLLFVLEFVLFPLSDSEVLRRSSSFQKNFGFSAFLVASMTLWFSVMLSHVLLAKFRQPIVSTPQADV